jgi:hypothetical protein
MFNFWIFNIVIMVFVHFRRIFGHKFNKQNCFQSKIITALWTILIDLFAQIKLIYLMTFSDPIYFQSWIGKYLKVHWSPDLSRESFLVNHFSFNNKLFILFCS